MYVQCVFNDHAGFPTFIFDAFKRRSRSRMSLSDAAAYLPPLEFVEVVRVPQISLASVSALPININEDVGVGSSAEHVTGEDAHFVGVDCQDKRGDE